MGAAALASISCFAPSRDLLYIAPGNFPLDDSPRVHAARVNLEVEKLAIWPQQNIFLLRFQDFGVFGKDRRLTVADAECQATIFCLKIAAIPQ